MGVSSNNGSQKSRVDNGPGQRPDNMGTPQQTAGQLAADQQWLLSNTQQANNVINDVNADPLLTAGEKGNLLSDISVNNWYDRQLQFKKKQEEVRAYVAKREGMKQQMLANPGKEGTILTGTRGLDYKPQSELASGIGLR